MTHAGALALFSAFLFPAVSPAVDFSPPPAYMVKTVAGDSVLGDGGPAAEAVLQTARSLIADEDGSVYVTDQSHNRVRRITPEGLIETVAGTWRNWARGVPASPDPLQTLINEPFFVARHPDGSLLITNRDLIWRLDQNNEIAIIAGRGTAENPEEDGAPMLEARLNSFQTFAVSPDGLIYFTTVTRPRQVRRFTREGVLETVAGAAQYDWPPVTTGPANEVQFFWIQDIAFDAAGNLHISDGSTLRKLGLDGQVRLLAGGVGVNYGLETAPGVSPGADPLAVEFSGITMAVSPGGDVYFTSPGHTELEPNGSARDWRTDLYRLKAEPGARLERLSNGEGIPPHEGERIDEIQVDARALAVDGEGNVYALTQRKEGRDRIWKIASDGTVTHLAGRHQYAGDGGPAVEATLRRPEKLSSDGDGGFYLTSAFDGVVRHVDRQGEIQTVAGGARRTSFDDIDKPYTLPADPQSLKVTYPAVVVSDRDGGFYLATRTYFAHINKHREVRHAGGTPGRTAYRSNDPRLQDGQPFAGQMLPDSYQAFTLDDAGRIVFADMGSIWRVESDGTLRRIAGTGVARSHNAEGPALETQIHSPWALTSHEGSLYFTDASLRVKKLTPEGRIEWLAGGGTEWNFRDITQTYPARDLRFSVLRSLAITPDGVLHLSAFTGAVMRLLPGGLLQWVAGNEFMAPGTDGGPALNTSFNNVTAMTAMEDGSMLVADSLNHRIRQLVPLTAAAFVKRGGDGQITEPGEAFPEMLAAAVVDEAGVPIALMPVAVEVIEGEAELIDPPSLTGRDGLAQVQVVAGEAGPVRVQFIAAGYEPLVFDLLAGTESAATAPPPVLLAPEDPLTPGAVTVLRGTGLAPRGKAAVTEEDLVHGRLPVMFRGVCVAIGGQAAPILGAAPDRIAVQAPLNLPPGPAMVRVTRFCDEEETLPGEEVEVEVVAAAPRFVTKPEGDIEVIQAAPGEAEGNVVLFVEGIGAPADTPAGSLIAERTAVQGDWTIWLAGQELTVDEIHFIGWAPASARPGAGRLAAFDPAIELLLPATGIVEISLPEWLEAEPPWPVTLRAGEAFTPDNTWLRPPPPD